MRCLLVILFCVYIPTNFSVADSVEDIGFFERNFDASSLQLALYSYKPELGDLSNVLQNAGINSNTVEWMPTLSLVLQHIPELDSRLEIGYWRTELQTPAPATLSLTSTLIPISYHLIYRPVLLYQYMPIYFGAGVGLLSASFDGNMVDLLNEQGIALSNSGSSMAGYVIVGIELYQWKSQPNRRASIGNNASISIELKRMMKSLSTSGTPPLNIRLDGTAIGFGVRTEF